MKMKVKRIASIAIASLLTLTAFTACGPAKPPAADATKTEAPADAAKTEAAPAEGAQPAGKKEITYKGEITFYPQAYNPVAPTEKNPNPPTKFKEVAADYEKLHPDIKITFTESPAEGTDYVTYLKTKISGGMAPDIVIAQYGELRGGTYPKGAFTDLNKFLDMPNPYVEGNVKWRDMFKPSILNQIAGTNGEQWVIDGDYVSTAIIYNKAMFAKAGITETPKNWNEYVAVMQKLKDSGVTPLAYPFGNNGDSKDRLTWLSRLFLTNYYAPDFDKLSVTKSSDVNLSQAEVAVAIKNGYYSSSDPRWLGWWQQVKDMTPYLAPDFLSAANTPDTIFSMFVTEKIAMYFDGSWAGNNLKDAKCAFEWGSFPFPSPMTGGTDKYASDFVSSNAVGGPSAAWQHCVPTKQANSSLTDEKLDAVIDWLMFTTTPENNAKVVNEKGSFVPIVQGAKAAPGMEELSAALDSKAMILDGATGGSLSSNFLDVYYRTFQDYMVDKITIEEAGKLLDAEANKEADKIIKDSKEDLTQYIKK